MFALQVIADRKWLDSANLSPIGQIRPRKTETGPRAEETRRARLELISPNPCEGQAQIPFTLEGKATVTIKLYDTLGNEVAVLMDHKEHGKAGAYQAQLDIDASRLSSGVYFVQMSAAMENENGTYTTLYDSSLLAVSK